MKVTGLLNLAPKAFKTNDNEIIRVGGRANKMSKNLFKFQKQKNNKSRNLMRASNIKVIGKPIFLIFNTKKTFNYF